MPRVQDTQNGHKLPHSIQMATKLHIPGLYIYKRAISPKIFRKILFNGNAYTAKGGLCILKEQPR